MFRRFVIILSRCINHGIILIALIIRPYLGPAQCRFYETCTPHIVRQLKEKAPHHALWCIIKRLIMCSPLSYFLKKV